MINTLLAKVIGTQNERELKRLRPIVVRVNELESSVRGLDDAALRAKTIEFRDRVTGGASLDDDASGGLRGRARGGTPRPQHASFRRAAHRRHGAARWTDRRDEDGRRQDARRHLPAYLNALEGKGVHVVTVNDYLARRDSEWMGKIYRFLGMSVGVIQHELNDAERQVAYASDVTYGTNNEFGFDYLRDNMKFELAQYVQRGHRFAIVDEVDSILIDEARTPLIISGPAEDSTDLYYEVDRIIPKLSAGAVTQGHTKAEDRERLEATGDYLIDEKHKTVQLTESGMAKAEKLLAHRIAPGSGGLYDPANMPLLHHVHQGLRAHTIFRRDTEYMVKDGQVVIVDEFTGRSDAGTAMERRPAPGGRGQGEGQDRARESDARDDHLPELLPQVRQALRHDRYRGDGSRGVREDLQARRHRRPAEPAARPQGRAGQRLSNRAREAGSDSRGHRQQAGVRASDARRHGLDREVREAERHAQAARHQAHRPEREVPRAGSRRSSRRPAGGPP